MVNRVLRMLALWCSFAAPLASCSDGAKSVACKGDACDLDAGESTPATTSSSSRDAGFGSLKPIPDGGPPDGWVPDLDLELQAAIQINGKNLPCGACSVVAVQAQGGRRPYTYTWSDPSLQGPGPHMLCPSAPTTLSVTVRDSSETSGEVSLPARVTEASAELSCQLDSGVAADSVGCKSGGSFDSTAEPPLQCDSSPDGGMLTENGLESFVESSAKPPLPLRAGQSYQFIYDHLVPLVLGKGVTVDVYGAVDTAPCEKLEKLFTFRLDGTWHQSLCFSAPRDYDRVVTHVQLDGVWFWFELGEIGTLCKGCDDG